LRLGLVMAQRLGKILFDAIFSATAFHWIDLSTKHKKCCEALNNDGLLVVYWNNYGIEDNEIQGIYIKMRMETE
jgi:hypothetical protein